jgi:hypothetical protein
MTPAEFIRERLDNCHAIAATKSGRDRDGWLKDAEMFSGALEAMADKERLNAKLLAIQKAANDLAEDVGRPQKREVYWNHLERCVLAAANIALMASEARGEPLK